MKFSVKVWKRLTIQQKIVCDVLIEMFKPKGNERVEAAMKEAIYYILEWINYH